MTKTKYQAVLFFQGHKPGEKFEADLDPVLERRAIDRGQIKKTTAKKEEEKADG